MTYKYDRLYLEDVMGNLGAMMDYGVHGLGYSASGLYSRFISSGLAALVEKGHPRYLSGVSGIEMAQFATGESADGRDFTVFPGPEYWAGWAVAYLQWESGRSFAEMSLLGMDIDTVIAMYHPYHEADITKFSEDARNLMDRKEKSLPSRLSVLRKAAGMTQEDLAAKSGVALRTIRSYEQSSRSLLKAETGTLMRLCSAIHCPLDYLL